MICSQREILCTYYFSKFVLHLIGGLQLVPLPCDVCPGHTLCHDDPHQLVQPFRHHRHHLLQQQLSGDVGEDHLLLAGCGHLPLVHDRPSYPGRQRLWLLNTKISISSSVQNAFKNITYSKIVTIAPSSLLSVPKKLPHYWSKLKLKLWYKTLV